jgi:hypothetical protein
MMIIDGLRFWKDGRYEREYEMIDAPQICGA